MNVCAPRLVLTSALSLALAVRPAPAQQPSSTPSTSRSTYFEFAPERLAELLPGSPAPHYPRELRAQHVGGEVVAQFVVDTLGRVVPGTFAAISSPHPLFTRALRANLTNLRFRPAQVGGRAVSQLVQHSFTFDPNSAAADETVIARDNAAVAADSVAGAAADTISEIARYSFEDEELAAKWHYGLDVVRHGTRDAVVLWRAATGGRRTLATLSLPGREGARLLVVRSCTLDGRADPEVMGLVAIGRDGHRATRRPTRAWRASREHARFESLPPKGVRCEDEEDVD